MTGKTAVINQQFLEAAANAGRSIDLILDGFID